MRRVSSIGVRVVALWEGSFHFRDVLTTMGGITIHVEEYATAAPAVS